MTFCPHDDPKGGEEITEKSYQLGEPGSHPFNQLFINI
jgi:hypothetical protein